MKITNLDNSKYLIMNKLVSSVYDLNIYLFYNFLKAIDKYKEILCITNYTIKENIVITLYYF